METGVDLQAPDSVRRLQTALHAKAKGDPGCRFYTLSDKLPSWTSTPSGWKVGFAFPVICGLHPFRISEVSDNSDRRLRRLAAGGVKAARGHRQRHAHVSGRLLPGRARVCSRTQSCVRVLSPVSKALGLRFRQLAEDWERQQGVRPVLVETYVDSRRHKETCYHASNWRDLGSTEAPGALGAVPAKTPKTVFLYPPQRDWQAVLLGRALPEPVRQRFSEPLQT